jgi:alpha-glucosidase
VRAEFDRILELWFARDVAGFRIDVAHMIIKDRELRDNPPSGPDDPLLDQVRGQRQEYNSNRPEVHDVHKRWRALADSYPAPRLLVGETFVEKVEEVIPFYGDGDELGLAFNMPFLLAPFEAPVLADIAERMIEGLPAGCSPVWTASNHDVSRFPTRWADGDPAAARCALLMLLTLPGAVFLYYGDELGMPDTPLTPEQRLDPVSKLFAPVLDRDAARTPMPWTGDAGAGFTTPSAEPWLPFGDVAACNVAAQHTDPASTLHLARSLIALRKGEEDLRAGAYARLALDGSLWAWRRGDSMVVACNLGDAPATVDPGPGHIVLATDRALDTTEVTGPLTLPAWTAIVMRRSRQ